MTKLIETSSKPIAQTELSTDARSTFIKEASTTHRKQFKQTVMEKAKFDFNSNIRNQISDSIFLGFPLKIRDYFESQTSSVKSGIRNHILSFEEAMHCFDEV